MNDEIAIQVENLGKMYRIYDRPVDRLKQMLWGQHIKRPYGREFWANRNLTFQVRRGSALGILGSNGAGKSTALQMIAGVLEPTIGQIRTIGRVTALLELGSGFNPEFTGRENIINYTLVMGLSRDFAEKKTPDIIKFAEIDDFIDQPIKTYSSGMVARLAYAVSANIEPDILIIDEALSVGDVRFQAKCMRSINEMRSKGTTLLFVSHSAHQVMALCDDALWLQKGEVRMLGNAKEVAYAYENYMRDGYCDVEMKSDTDFKKGEETAPNMASWQLPEGTQTSRDGFKVERYRFVNRNGASIVIQDNTEESQYVTFEAILNLPSTVAIPLIGFGIFDANNRFVVHYNSQTIDFTSKTLAAGKYKFIYSFHLPRLHSGEYFISIGLDDGVVGESLMLCHAVGICKFCFSTGKRTEQYGLIQADKATLLIERVHD